jgi:hypothetical protein
MAMSKTSDFKELSAWRSVFVKTVTSYKSTRRPALVWFVEGILSTEQTKPSSLLPEAHAKHVVIGKESISYEWTPSLAA